MASKEHYITQSYLGDTERAFKEACEDVRSAARIYGGFRSTNPTSRGTVKARNSWNLNVILWISSTVVLEEALETVLVLEHATDPTAAVPDRPAVDLSTVDLPTGRLRDKAPIPAQKALDQVERSATARPT
ncbi:hypothetical protein GCM10022254_63710 [Actinomadura meridiana]|uniref:Uncharacterized protein n=1 Tax=Actinomadura meridiana TaxID=559626 RepID=A0ABP8CK58_9ACTN